MPKLHGAFVDEIRNACIAGNSPNISDADILSLLNDWTARAGIIDVLRQEMGNDSNLRRLVLEFLAETAAGLDHLANSDENWIDTLDKVAFPLGIGGLLAAVAGTVSGQINLFEAGLIVAAALPYWSLVRSASCSGDDGTAAARRPTGFGVSPKASGTRYERKHAKRTASLGSEFVRHLVVYRACVRRVDPVETRPACCSRPVRQDVQSDPRGDEHRSRPACDATIAVTTSVDRKSSRTRMEISKRRTLRIIAPRSMIAICRSP